MSVVSLTIRNLVLESNPTAGYIVVHDKDGNDRILWGTLHQMVPATGFKRICQGCGFIMHGGSPASCGRCGRTDLVLAIEDDPKFTLDANTEKQS